MIYLPLIFFFISLIGIIVMIGYKLVLIKNGQINETIKIEHLHPFVPEIQKIKKLTFKNLKKIGYIIIFIILRFFIKFSNLIKTKSIIFINKLKNKIKKNKNILSETTEKKEVSKYLKTIGEYRQKIRKMKYIIKKEEGIE